MSLLTIWKLNDTAVALQVLTKAHGVPAGMMFPQGAQGQQATAAGGQRLVAERRWRLGVHSRGHPHRIIEDLLRALHALSVGYKKVAPYNYKCRKLYAARGACPAPHP